jgi:hypothetical protein
MNDLAKQVMDAHVRAVQVLEELEEMEAAPVKAIAALRDADDALSRAFREALMLEVDAL